MEKMAIEMIELGRLDWSRFRDIRAFAANPVVSAEYIPNTIEGLLQAETEAEAEKRYWEIENHVVVQGQTFEAAEYLVPVLIASLNSHQPAYVKNRILELIFQMVAYSPHNEEVKLGNDDLTEKCRAKAREGLWILYKLFMEGSKEETEAVRIILEKIETDIGRLEAFMSVKENSTGKAQPSMAIDSDADRPTDP